MKKLSAALMISATTAGSAFAACVHNGIYYEHGAVLCFEGYLQECTVADYWKAIGTCNAADPRRQLTERTPVESMLIAMVRDARPEDARIAAVRR